jgi:hypothetical protein
VTAGTLILILLAVIVALLWPKGPGPREAAVKPVPPAEVKTAAPAAQTPAETPLPKVPAPAAAPAPPSAPAPAAPPAAVTPAPSASPPAAAPLSTPAPPAPEPSLEDQVKETLNTLKEAQLKGDIILFMSCYSYVFPQLDRKRRETLGNWDDFPFLALDYTLEGVKSTGPDSALARVTWSMQVQSRKTRKISEFVQTYDVVLARELGKWRIYSLKEMKPDEEE